MAGSAKPWAALAAVLIVTCALQPVSSSERKEAAGTVSSGTSTAGTLIAELPVFGETEPTGSLPNPGALIVPSGMRRNDYTTIRHFCRTLRPETRDLLLSCR